MSLRMNIAGLVASLIVLLLARWRETRTKLGEVPLIPAFYIQFAALIAFLVLTANLISLVTGINWKSPTGH